MPSALPVTPRWSVKSTLGVDSHFGALGIHTGLATHPQGRQRLAVRPSARPLPNGPFGRGRERPLAPRAWCGLATSVDSHPRPGLPEVAPEPKVPCGKAIRTPPRDAADQPILRRWSPLANRLAAVPARVRTQRRWPRPPNSTMAPAPRSGSATTQRPPFGFRRRAMETAAATLNVAL